MKGHGYYLKNVSMQGYHAGKDNKITAKHNRFGDTDKADATTPSDSLFKKPVFYVYLMVFIYSMTSLISAYEIQKQGDLDDKVNKEIIMWPLSMLKDLVAGKK
jgi:hypothetical protein